MISSRFDRRRKAQRKRGGVERTGQEFLCWKKFLFPGSLEPEGRNGGFLLTNDAWVQISKSGRGHPKDEGGTRKMTKRRYQTILGFLMVLWAVVFMAQPSMGATIDWVDWVSATGGFPGSAGGTLSSYGISVGYSGEVYFAQTSGGTNYWVPNTPYLNAVVSNAPSSTDIITLLGGIAPAVTNTVTFSSPVQDPVMALVSLGRPDQYYVRYHFDSPFTILSYGPGFWGAPGTLSDLGANVLQGEEGHGVIQFSGTYSSISWYAEPWEEWHGFTFGVAAAPAPVPEPSLWMLFGTGLAGMGLIRRRFRK
jgi:hypothetical protein